MARQWLRRFGSLFDFFLVKACPLCQRPATTGILCQACDRQLRQSAWKDWELAQPTPVFTWGRYEGTLKRALSALKYEGHLDLAQPLGSWLAEAWLNHPQTDRVQSKFQSRRQLVAIPIPIHAEKLRQRGFNQAETIARAFCEVLDLSLIPNGLIRTRATTAQFGLSVADRQQNVSGAFQVAQHLKRGADRRQAVIVDDIYTTGATVRSAVSTLEAVGIPVVAIAVVARPPKQTLSRSAPIQE